MASRSSNWRPRARRPATWMPSFNRPARLLRLLFLPKAKITRHKDVPGPALSRDRPWHVFVWMPTLHAPAARVHDQVVDDHDHCNDEQNMDQAPADMQKQSQQPEHEQNNNDGPENA